MAHSNSIYFSLSSIEADILKDMLQCRMRSLAHELEADKMLLDTSVGMSIRDGYEAMYNEDYFQFSIVKSLYLRILENE